MRYSRGVPISPPIAAAILWVVWGVSWIIAAAFASAAKVRTPRATLVPVRVLAVGGAVLLFLPPRTLNWTGPLAHRLWPSPPALDWAWVALSGAGFAFCWWARLRLGRLWSSAVTLKEDHRLIEDGPYGLVRHPIYAGLVIAAVTTAMTRASPLALFGAGLMVIAFTLNARVEEGFLRQQLGAASYNAYARRVGMLIPRLGRS
ncbi:MAG TPA: isoprenylcysteine carboxylmethyltransferase family protein [Caulobacteraceae bacterium]|nr:isoprenylcysteine carboxylmethyltransferase family protein [Caulobacteraceae bacterium]